MRLLRVTPVTALAAAVVLLPAVSARATTPSPVAFNGPITVPAENCCNGVPGLITNTGTWTATGSVTGSFAVTEPTIFGDGAYHYVGTLTGAAGTITINVQARFLFSISAPPVFYVKGDWTISSGTGSYSNLHGNGDYAATVTVLSPAARPPAAVVVESLTGFAEYGSRN